MRSSPGFGGFRKIVLFDTLIQQLAEPELAAVLAHEIGHFKKKHIPKTLAASALGSLAGLYLVSLLAKQDWFYRGFGFEPGSIVPALLLFGLLSGVVTFWFSPVAHWWSRRYEYQADAFAAEVMNEPRLADRRAAQAEREEPQQPHAASALQRVLLFASDAARTRAGAGGRAGGWGIEAVAKAMAGL